MATRYLQKHFWLILCLPPCSHFPTMAHNTPTHHTTTHDTTTAPRTTDRDLESLVNAWICTCQETDRNLESSSTRRRVNAWICAQRATDRDLESVFVKRKVNAWICARHSTDRDPQSFNVNMCLSNNRP